MAPDDGNLLVVDDELFLREAVAASLLAIAAEIASAHGGAAHAAPAAPRGLRISLMLPVLEPPVPRQVRELAASVA
jgi:hypothetical protein